MELNIDILTILYHDLKSADRALKKNVDYKASILSKANQVVPELLTGSHFIPEFVKEYIKKHERCQFVYRSTIHKHPIQIHITSFDDSEEEEERFDKWARRMFMWLYIGFQYSGVTCAKELNIYLYPTPFEKRLPSSIHETVGPSHVNSGVTWRCSPRGEIVLFRREEWFKVFIHETFHTFGLDIEPHQVTILREKMRINFPIASDFNIAEAYTETWARILHTAFDSFERSKGMRGFSKLMVQGLAREKEHSLHQMHKILYFIGVPYSSLIGDTSTDALKRRMYREKSNVFAYYVLGGVLMNDPNGFMEWCSTNNMGFFNFDSSELAANRFGEYLIVCSRANDVFEMRGSNEVEPTSTRMTILEIN